MKRFSLNELTQTQIFTRNWPNVFPKQTIGIERNEIIIKNSFTPSDYRHIEVIPKSLEAIKMMKLKGYKIVIFFSEPLISQRKMSVETVDLSNRHLMEIFGKNGIFSIEGLYYATSNIKEDIYALPNTGMIDKAQKEIGLSFKKGYFVGDKIQHLKTSEKIHSKPILIKTDNYEETIKKLNSFSNKSLKEKTIVYDDLLDFALNLS